DRVRYILLIEVHLLEQGREELARLEAALADTVAFLRGIRPLLLLDRLGRQILPEELALVDDLAATHVEQVHRQHLVFVVIAEDIGIVAFYSRYSLLLLEKFQRGDQVAILGRQLVLLSLRRRRHPLMKRARKVGGAALQKHLHVMYRFGVALRS